MGLVLLGDVVVGVLLQVAELAGVLDALGDLAPRRSLQLLELDFQRGDALGRDRLAAPLRISGFGTVFGWMVNVRLSSASGAGTMPSPPSFGAFSVG
jgi:hypothetical protein